MKISFDDADLIPIVERIVAETLRQHGDSQAKVDGRLGYAESEAAALLGVQPHVLRDCRLREEISARKVGKRYIYSRDSLMNFLSQMD